MPLDPNIILQAGNFKTPDYATTLAQVANIKASGQEAKLRDLQIAGAQRENDTRVKLAQAFDPATGDVDPAKANAAFAASGDYQGAYKFNTDRLAAQNAQIDNALKVHGVISQVLGGVTDQTSLDAARAELGKNPALAQGVAQLPQQYDETGAAQIKSLLVQGQTIGEQLQQKKDELERQRQNANSAFTVGPDGQPVANAAFQNYETKKVGAAADAAEAARRAPLTKEQFDQKVALSGAQEKAKFDAQNGGQPKPIKVDSSSSSLNAQTGLSQFAINYLQGGALPRGQAQQAQVSREIQDWSVANGIDTATLRSQATGINHVVQQNIIRNNQGGILEKELQGTIRTLSPIADGVGNGKINVANIIDLWAGKQVNNPDVQKYRDQLLRLRTELAGYNAVAAGKLTEQGTPRVDQDDMRAAEQVILSGINSGGLKGLQDSVGATTAKNRNVLQNSIDDSNAQMWGLFGVGDNYKRVGPPLNLENPGGAPETKTINGVTYHKVNGQWMQ